MFLFAYLLLSIFGIHKYCESEGKSNPAPILHSALAAVQLLQGVGGLA